MNHASTIVAAMLLVAACAPEAPSDPPMPDPDPGPGGIVTAEPLEVCQALAGVYCEPACGAAPADCEAEFVAVCCGGDGTSWCPPARGAIVAPSVESWQRAWDACTGAIDAMTCDQRAAYERQFECAGIAPGW